MSKREKREVELMLSKLDIKIKKLWIDLLKQWLKFGQGVKYIFTPTRSKHENTFKLLLVTSFFVLVIILVVLIKKQ